MNAHTSTEGASALLDREVTIAFGKDMRAKRWLNETLTLRELLKRLSTHKVGTKDGTALLQGELLGTERKAAQVKNLHLLIVDLDTGKLSIDELAELIRQRGLFAFLWNTHSHGAQQTGISNEKLRKFRPELPAEPFVRGADDKLALAPGVLEAIIAFLHECDGYDPRVANSVWAVTFDTKTRELTVRHSPIDKVRALFILEQPFAVGDADGAANWSARYTDVCRWLGVPFDKACTDASRLFFLPRRPKESAAETFKTLTVDGKPLDLASVPRTEEPTRKANSTSDGTTAHTSNTQDPPEICVVESALRFLVGLADSKHFDMEDYDTWRDVGMALKLAYGPSGRRLWDLASTGFDSESACAHRADPKHAEIWKGFKSDRDNESKSLVTFATIQFKAREKGWPTAEEDFADIIAEGQDEQTKSENSSGEQIKSNEPLFVARPYQCKEPEEIEPRQWLGRSRHYIRKFVSVTAAMGGKGKTSLALVEALEMVTGRRLLAVKPDTEPTAEPLRVYYWNGEDPLEEVDRRIAAVRKHYGIKREEIEGRLFVGTGDDTKIMLAKDGRDGLRINTPMKEAMIAELKAKQIDVFTADPFIRSHGVPENDNVKIDAVCNEFREIARKANVSIELLHHVRKTGGAEVTAEDVRGASALHGAARSLRVINAMSEDEALKARVRERGCFFRVDNGKTSMIKAATAAVWRELKDVPLGNARAGLAGDDVGVAAAWLWPDDPEVGLPEDAREKAQEAIGEGEWLRSDQARERWAGVPIGEAVGLDPECPFGQAHIKQLIDKWIGQGHFKAAQAKDHDYKEKWFLRPVFRRSAGA